MSFHVETRWPDGTTAEARFDDFDDAFDWLTEQKRDNAGTVLRIAGRSTPEQRGRLGVLGVIEAG